MRQQSHRSRDPRDSSATTPARETDALLESSAQSYLHQSGSIRARRSSRSPTLASSQHFGSSQRQREQMNSHLDAQPKSDELQSPYHLQEPSRSGNLSIGDGSSKASSSRYVSGNRSVHSLNRRRHSVGEDNNNNNDHPPLLEIPEQVYAVRKSALTVLKPLTKTWLVVSVGFALTVLFGMARWTYLLQDLPYWFILLPSWLAHVGLFWCHIQSAKALSRFIAEANDSRQRPDSRDHLDRTEYLPLLQRSLKFGLKTGLISFGFFIFEILGYVRLAKGAMSLATVFTPLWIMVSIGIIDGIICKAQHPLRVLCWILSFAAMVLASLKVDYGFYTIGWRMVFSPIIAVLSISSASLIYIVYGHQVGYYRLTESQLTAGNLYSLATLISIVLAVIIGEVIPQIELVEIETRFFLVMMAPLVVSLVGMAAWVVSRDEFSRLLLYGGQAAVHPQRLRWESKGWTSVQGNGVTNIPMFGEVNFHPLGKREAAAAEMGACSRCYPCEDEEEEMPYDHDLADNPYFVDPSDSPRYQQPESV